MVNGADIVLESIQLDLGDVSRASRVKDIRDHMSEAVTKCNCVVDEIEGVIDKHESSQPILSPQ